MNVEAAEAGVRLVAALLSQLALTQLFSCLDPLFPLLSPFLFLLFSHIDFHLCFSAPPAQTLILRAGRHVTASLALKLDSESWKST